MNLSENYFFLNKSVMCNTRKRSMCWRKNCASKKNKYVSIDTLLLFS